MKKTAFFSMLIMFGVQVLSGQVTRGTISGFVADVTGGFMQEVTVTAMNQQTGASQNTSTDNTGRYRFTDLPAGTYELSFAREGFETVRQTLRLNTASAVLDVSLGPQAVSTLIVVKEAGGTVTDIAGKTTASRMDVPDKDMPVQVSSIPQQTLQVQGINDMVTAMRNVSGGSGTRRYGMYQYFAVRGFISGGPNSQGDVLLVDGMRLQGNRINSQLNNVEQIDVLKGPSSILYGGQALSGAVNVIRKKPEATPAYDLFYRVGRFNTHQVGGGATGQVFGLDRLLYRADVSYENTDGWRDAGSRRLNVSPVVNVLINERTRISIHESFNHDDFDLDAGIPAGVLDLPGFDLSRRFNTPQDFSHNRDSQTQVLFNLGLANNLELRNSFLYRWANDQYFAAEALTYRPTLNQVDRGFLYFKHHRRPRMNQTDLKGNFNLFRLRHAFVTGYEYEDYYNFTDRSTRSAPTTPINLTTFQETHVFVPDFPLSSIQYFSSRTHSFFWQDLISITEKLKVNVGGRFDNVLRVSRTDPWANGQPLSRGPEDRLEQSAYTYRIGVVQSITDSQEVYFSSATSFQPVVQVSADGRQLDPETGRSYEIGHRWRGFNGRFTANTAWYRIVRKHVVIPLANQLFDQAGQQSSKGVDIDLNGDLGSGIRLVANYGYTLPRFDEYFEGNGLVNLSGNRPRFVQRHAANLWLTKIFRSGFNASIGGRYLSSVFTSDRNTIRLGGWSTASAAVGYRAKFYDWSLNAENLFNRRRYFVSEINGNQIYPGSPIDVFTTIKFRFR